MFRFRLGPIPVEVHGSHVLFSAILALSFARGAGVAQGGGDPSQMLLFVLGWVLLVFVSVLVHELGHASVALAYGYRPSIQLAWLGGHTQPNAPDAIPWHRDVLLTAAGPAFGFLLAGAGYFTSQALDGSNAHAHYFARQLLRANLFWSVANLLPVLPLDGGRITLTVLGRLFGRVGHLLAHLLATGLALAVSVYALASEDLLLLLFFGPWAYHSAAAVYATWKQRGSAAPGALSPALAEAVGALRAGQVDRARQLAEAGQREATSPEDRARFGRVLAWASIKEGDGRAALRYLSELPAAQVEPHALAAALSLSGDDVEALPLWKRAHQLTGDPTLLHEWAGALLRLGREREALGLPGVDPAAAFACAERVAFTRGAFSEAAALGERGLAVSPNAQAAYNAACAYARAGDRDAALRLLHRASELGFTDGAYASTDADLAALHGHPGFHRWWTDAGKSGAS